jgi:transcriptional regulator with XRE-family HTH domain
MSTTIGFRIKQLREYRNYTQQFMADSLELSQNAYCKIETGMTKLTTDRLEDIARILDTPIENLLSNDKQVFNFENSKIDKFYGYIENLYEENKEMQQRQLLINERLLTVIEKLANKFNS